MVIGGDCHNVEGNQGEVGANLHSIANFALTWIWPNSSSILCNQFFPHTLSDSVQWTSFHLKFNSFTAFRGTITPFRINARPPVDARIAACYGFCGQHWLYLSQVQQVHSKTCVIFTISCNRYFLPSFCQFFFPSHLFYLMVGPPFQESTDYGLM